MATLGGRKILNNQKLRLFTADENKRGDRALITQYLRHVLKHCLNLSTQLCNADGKRCTVSVMCGMVIERSIPGAAFRADIEMEVNGAKLASHSSLHVCLVTVILSLSLEGEVRKAANSGRFIFTPLCTVRMQGWESADR